MRHFAEYADCRRMFTEYDVIRLPGARSVKAALGLMPDNAAYFRLYDIIDSVDVPEGRPGLSWQPQYKRLNESGWFFPGGRVFTLEQVEVMARYDAERYSILASNMRGNGYNWIVKHRHGGFQNFDPERDRCL